MTALSLIEFASGSVAACAGSGKEIGSPVEPASVHYEDVAVEVVAGRGGKKDGSAGEVFRLAPAAGGNALQNLAGALGIIAQRLGVVGIHIAGRDGVHVDAFRGPLVGEGFGKLTHTAFGRRVRRHQNSTLKGKQRGDVDNFARAALEHVAASVLGEAKDAGEINVDDRLPVFFGVIDGGRTANDARVVDQNIDGAELLEGFFDEPRADGRVADIANERGGFDAEGLDLLLRGRGSGAGAVHRDIGAGLGESDGDGCT
jgi:hypothetical protein